MSSFHESSFTKIRLKPSKTINDSLPSLHQAVKKAKCKDFSQSIHQMCTMNNFKISRNNQNSPVRNAAQKKQTLVSFFSRSMYRLPTNTKKTEDIPVIEFSQALLKIEEIFNQEFSITQPEIKLKMKKTLSGKITLGRLGEFQTLLVENPKKLAKKQFEEIFRLFDKTPLRCVQNTRKQQREGDFVVIRRTRKHNTLLSSLMNEQRESSSPKPGQQTLSQQQKQELMKLTIAFQKAEKHLMLKSYTIRIFYHHLNSQLAMQIGCLEQALSSLYYCEYYARKIDFDHYIIPCLVMQSEVKQALYQFDDAVKILKTALEFSIVKRWKDLQMRILQKVSIVYYYRGNSYMAKFYKEISETGLPQSEVEIYIKEYSKGEELRSLQSRLFSLPFDGISKKKHNEKYELDISRDLFMDHENMIISKHEEVSEMLRSNKTSKIGIKLRKMIIENTQKADVTKFGHNRHDSQLIPRYVGFDYPMDHCNQILKSHLSRSRMSVGCQIKSVSFMKTLGFMKSLYRKISFELINEKQILMENKENLHKNRLSTES